MSHTTPELRKLGAWLIGSTQPPESLPRTFSAAVFAETTEPTVMLTCGYFSTSGSLTTPPFSELKRRLPGPLTIHRETSDAADIAIRRGMRNPVLVDRRIVCLWTPPKPLRDIKIEPKPVRSPVREVKL